MVHDLIMMHSCSLLSLLVLATWVLLGLDQKLVSLVDSTGEVLIVGKQLFEVHNVFIQECTRDNWSEFIAENSLDGLVNVVSDKGSSFITLELIELGKVNLWQLQHLLASWLLLVGHLTRILITLHVLLLLVAH